MSEPTPKQLHVREIADFTADGDRVVTRKYVLLDDYERLTRLVKIREAEIDWHVDEDKRLRAALEQIADCPSIECARDPYLCKAWAREALGEPKP